MVSRRQLLRAAKGRGWMVQAPALEAILDFLNQQDDNDNSTQDLERVLDALGRQLQASATTVVTEDVWRLVLEEADKKHHAEGDDDASMEEDHVHDDSPVVELVNAFETPKLMYDSTRRAFRLEDKPLSLLGTAEDKVNMMAQRYALIHQRLVRGAKHQKDFVGLTPIESLLGRQTNNIGQEDAVVLVMGILTQATEGSFLLEDSTGQVSLAFTLETSAVQSCYITEHAIFLVEGIFLGEVLQVVRMGSPFPEPRANCLHVLKQQVRHAHYQPSLTHYSNSNNSHPPRLVVLSDVHLDQPSVLALLEGLFQSTVEEDNNTGGKNTIFCLMGNFSSTTSSLLSNHKNNNHQGWEDLAKLIAKYPLLAKHAHFVFVPGPNDTQCGILPLIPLNEELVKKGLEKTFQSKKIQNVHWGSNPCRLRLAETNRELVLFRYDVLPMMMQNQLLLPSMADNLGTADKKKTTTITPQSRMLTTIVDQGHLLPVAKAPIFWNCDHALRLFPPPNMLVVGGGGGGADESLVYGGCNAVHVGSFAKNGTFGFYDTSNSNDEESDDDDDDDLNKSRSNRFQFSQAEEVES